MRGHSGHVRQMNNVVYSSLSKLVKRRLRLNTNLSVLQLKNISDNMFDDRTEKMNSGCGLETRTAAGGGDTG